MFTINREQWQVVLVEPNDIALLMPNGRFAIGACSDPTKTIYISNNLHGQSFERVLCHELVHAAMFAYDVNLSVADEELLANMIAVFGEEIIDLTDGLFTTIRRGRY